MSVATNWLNESDVFHDLSAAKEAARDLGRVRALIEKARSLSGLTPSEAAVLCCADDPESRAAIHSAAGEVKQTIYGRRLVIFTPLYVSNLCANDCAYCAFRSGNRDIVRRSLSYDEIAAETSLLIDEGHRRILLVAGEAYPREGFDYVLNAIDSIYSVTREKGSIRRINVNVAPLEVAEFKQLHDRRIGTYQIFQETYDREVYARVHRSGRKRDYDWRLQAMDRAMTAGVDDVGVGVLFGLADWRFEVLAMLRHAEHLNEAFGVGPHTISVPRLEPATGAELANQPPCPVDDETFKTIVAVLRLAVPYTGIIMSTRETAAMRRDTFALGVSQISAGSRTSPGGYNGGGAEPQFSLGDHRSLDEVVRDVADMGYTPSFCTGCYRMGRTGADFMDLARPGDIQAHCDPNGLSSYQEYLLDHASPETRTAGDRRIATVLETLEPASRLRAEHMLAQVRGGRRDVYC